MAITPGVFSAEALIRVGLEHTAVVSALCREVGLSLLEAELAWEAAAANRRTVLPIHGESFRRRRL